MIAVYTRVSTTDQNIEGQNHEMMNWVNAHGKDEEVKWYEDKYTGTTMDRPQFKTLQKDIAKGKIKTVAFWKIDRISRSMMEGLTTITDWVDKDVRVVSITQNIDLSGIMGRMVAANLFAFSELETETRRERCRIGIKRAKEAGKYKGRKPGTYKADLKEVYKYLDQGMTCQEVGKITGVSKMSVSRYARRREQERTNPQPS